MQTEKPTLAGERTQSVVEFSEQQFARRHQAEIDKALSILITELETEEDIRNSMASRLAQNQQLKTPEERKADGFSILYGDLNKAQYRVASLRESIRVLKSLRD